MQETVFGYSLSDLQRIIDEHRDQKTILQGVTFDRNNLMEENKRKGERIFRRDNHIHELQSRIDEQRVHHLKEIDRLNTALSSTGDYAKQIEKQVENLKLTLSIANDRIQSLQNINNEVTAHNDRVTKRVKELENQGGHPHPSHATENYNLREAMKQAVEHIKLVRRCVEQFGYVDLNSTYAVEALLQKALDTK